MLRLHMYPKHMCYFYTTPRVRFLSLVRVENFEISASRSQIVRSSSELNPDKLVVRAGIEPASRPNLGLARYKLAALPLC